MKEGRREGGRGGWVEDRMCINHTNVCKGHRHYRYGVYHLLGGEP